MTLTQLAPPYPIFTDKSGSPLDNGYLYFGTANLNPETNPITVYYDSLFTQPAAQPLRTSNGYVMRNGSPAIIYANSQFSVTVRDKKKALVIYSPVGYGIVPGTTASNTDQMTYNEGDTGAVTRVLTSRLQDQVTVKDFGAVGDGVADDTAAIQAMVAAVGWFTLPAGVFKITDEILIPAGVYGAIWSGAGMEQSTILCVGMAGKKALKVATTTNLYRHTMRDFSIAGDCDTCIDLTTSSGAYQVYQCEYRNLRLSSSAGSAFVAKFHFSCSWYNVHVYSVSGHGFDLEGGNSTVLINCYAHNIGAGKAGYRIKAGATLISCNGLDSGDYWGIFGSTVASDGKDYQYLITMIGCNVEDFGISAIRLYYTGIFVADRVGFVPKATGTYTAIIDGTTFSASSGTVNIRNSRITSKGSTLSSASNILINNPTFVKSTGGEFPNYYNTNAALVYPASVETMSLPFFQVAATRFDQLDAARYWGFSTQVPSTWTVNATTVSLAGRNTINTANTVATSFQTASGGVEGQRITIIVKEANTTIVHNFAAGGRFLNKSGANYVAASGNVYSYVYNGTNWVEA